MASRLHSADLDIAAAVGRETGAEFSAFVQLYDNIPDLTAILSGNGTKIKFSTEPSVGYATTIGLAVRAKNVEQAYHGFSWLTENAATEWVNLFMVDLMTKMKNQGKLGELAILIKKDPKLQQFFSEYRELLGNL